MTARSGFRPAARLSGLEPYRPPRTGGDTHRLHANEGRAPPQALAAVLAAVDLARYPAAGEVEARLAEAHGVDAAKVVLTAGGDDALARIAYAGLEPGRKAALFTPTFEMIPRYVQLAGAEAVLVPWLDGPFPEAAFREALARSDMGFVVTPSSPAGEVASQESLLRLAEAAAEGGQSLVADLAYAEFADEDPTDALVARGDVVITRTFSKALGVAGLRAGYAIAPRPIADALRVAGQPFAVSSLTLAVVAALLETRAALAEAAARRVRNERTALFEALDGLGCAPIPSQGNFVLARVGSGARAFAESLGSAGLRVRVFEHPEILAGSVRITCPQDDDVFRALMSALPDAADAAQART